ATLPSPISLYSARFEAVADQIQAAVLRGRPGTGYHALVAQVARIWVDGETGAHPGGARLRRLVVRGHHRCDQEPDGGHSGNGRPPDQPADVPVWLPDRPLRFDPSRSHDLRVIASC